MATSKPASPTHQGDSDPADEISSDDKDDDYLDMNSVKYQTNITGMLVSERIIKMSALRDIYLIDFMNIMSMMHAFQFFTPHVVEQIYELIYANLKPSIDKPNSRNYDDIRFKKEHDKGA